MGLISRYICCGPYIQMLVTARAGLLSNTDHGHPAYIRFILL